MELRRSRSLSSLVHNHGVLQRIDTARECRRISIETEIIILQRLVSSYEVKNLNEFVAIVEPETKMWMHDDGSMLYLAPVVWA